MAPELGDGAVLPFLIARVQANGSRSQRVDQQAVGSPGAAREQSIPALLLPLDASTAQEPVDRVKRLEVRAAGRGRLFTAEQLKCALQMFLKRAKREPHSWKLQATEVV